MLTPAETSLLLRCLRADDKAFTTVDEHVQFMTGADNIEGKVVTWAYFQPSAEAKDWLDNAKAWKSDLGNGVKVHSGFLAQFKSANASGAVGYRDLYLGHSLGGALATLFCYFYPGSSAITAGQPRVGNKAFCDEMADRRVLRVVNTGDPVPHVPPLWLGYRHCGDVTKVRSPATTFLQRVFRVKTVHYPASYCQALEA